MINPLHSGTPAGLMEYITQNNGLQHACRFRVSILRMGEEFENTFLCNLAQVPSARIKIYQDILSGSSSPIPIPYGIEYSSNILEFSIEESWISRAYFEKWQSSIFAVSGGETKAVPILNNRVRFYDDIIGKIRIEAISVQGNIVPATYQLYGCVPMEIVPTQFESLNGFNNVLKFSVNMIYRYYTVTTSPTPQ